MKTSLAVLAIAIIGVAAFLLGRGGPHLTPPAEKKPTALNQRTASSHSLAAAATKAGITAKPRTSPDALTLGQAQKMSPEERIALLKKAALLADPEKQADILCGLISAMQQDELVESTRTLLDAQRKGNSWSQEVWNTLWTQWGRVAPVACLELSKQGERYPGWNGLDGLNTYNDYRCLMAGWLEVHPVEAMAWAQQPKDNMSEAMGAAFAITSSAGGDLQQMEAAILSVSASDLTVKACMQDYFDLAHANGEPPAAVYAKMNPQLQAAAWPEVLDRLTRTDMDEAMAWYEKHDSDAGVDHRAAAELVGRLSMRDPEKAARWAVSLPAIPRADHDKPYHPASAAFSVWLQRDPDAANRWMQTQQDSPWVKSLREETHTPPF